MFIPKEFREEDEGVILSLVKENPLGTLVQSSPHLQACHLPFLLEKDGDELYLEAHLAKANLQAQFIDGESVLVIFTGAKGYVSSAVYEKVNAPTYNYQAVHFSGNIKRLHREELLNHLHKLVQTHEYGRSKQFSIEQMNAEMLIAYLDEIVGIRIKVSKIEAANKLSQNRSEKDFHAIVEDLRQEASNDALIAAMKKTR